jgi:hypothetical protein
MATDRVLSGVLGGGGLWVEQGAVFMLPTPLHLDLPIFPGAASGGMAEPLTFIASQLPEEAQEEYVPIQALQSIETAPHSIETALHSKGQYLTLPPKQHMDSITQHRDSMT